MGTVVADSEKERLIFARQVGHLLDRHRRLCSVEVRVVRYVDTFGRDMFQVPLAETVDAARVSLGDELLFPLFQPRHVLLGAIDRIGIERVSIDVHLGLAPGDRVLDVVVEDLADADSAVAVRHELLRQRDRLRRRLPKIGPQVPHADRIGPQAGHQARARRVAHRLLAVGPSKRHGRCGEPIDVRALGDLGPVAAEFLAQIVDRNEQDIERLPPGSRRWRLGQRDFRGEDGKKKEESEPIAVPWVHHG